MNIKINLLEKRYIVENTNLHQLAEDASPMVTIPTTSLGYSFDITIGAWSEGLTAYRRHSNGTMERIEGGIGIGLDFVLDESFKNTWLSSIPNRLMQNTSLFPEHQYQMLWLAANSKNAREILEVRPLILAIICERFHVDNVQALKLAELGQRQILEHLGFASTKAALKFIDKLDLTFERTSEIFHVMKMIDVRTCYFKRFSHYTKVNFSSLSLDNTHPFLTGTRLGKSLGELKNTTRLKLTLLIEDTLMLGNALGVHDPIQVIVNLKSYGELADIHDLWVERRNQMRMESMKPKDADVPYVHHFDAYQGIEQISDYYDLCTEGNEMRHCISVYHNRISSGNYVALRMTTPERMTIGLKVARTKQFPYEIDQIAGSRNKLPSEDTRKKVFDWLNCVRSNYAA